MKLHAIRKYSYLITEWTRQKAACASLINLCLRSSNSLEASGEVFCWGSNQYGQCGVDPSNTESKLLSFPVQIGGILKKVRVSKILSGWSHILVKTGNIGECFESNERNQCIFLESFIFDLHYHNHYRYRPQA